MCNPSGNAILRVSNDFPRDDADVNWVWPLLIASSYLIITSIWNLMRRRWKPAAVPAARFHKQAGIQDRPSYGMMLGFQKWRKTSYSEAITEIAKFEMVRGVYPPNDRTETFLV
jgi:hypothetical protein